MMSTTNANRSKNPNRCYAVRSRTKGGAGSRWTTRRPNSSNRDDSSATGVVAVRSAVARIRAAANWSRRKTRARWPTAPTRPGTLLPKWSPILRRGRRQSSAKKDGPFRASRAKVSEVVPLAAQFPTRARSKVARIRPGAAAAGASHAVANRQTDARIGPLWAVPVPEEEEAEATPARPRLLPAVAGSDPRALATRS